MKWISIDEQSPPYLTWVIVAAYSLVDQEKFYSIFVAAHETDHWIASESGCLLDKIITVTHWMPIPEIPNE